MAVCIIRNNLLYGRSPSYSVETKILYFGDRISLRPQDKHKVDTYRVGPDR
jgi:hypothetical protein